MDPDDEDREGWRERLARRSDMRAKTGDDPRWRKEGAASEMGVLSGLRWAVYLAEIGVRAREIPGEFWSIDADDDGAVAIVACPCGHTPVVKVMTAPHACADGDCECPRYFFFEGERVYCFNTPTGER